MSAAFGLVKFLSTGNIYYCCYEGTSDVLNPHICTPEIENIISSKFLAK